MTAHAVDAECGVVILAGGAATRLPKKLELTAAHVPMLVRVYRNVAGWRPTYISCNATPPPELDAFLPVPMVVDHWPGRGPLAGLLSTMEVMSTPWVFAVAGDAPCVDGALIEWLLQARKPNDDAVVPRHGDDVEPLAALYNRAAFLREGPHVLRDGDGALMSVIARLRTRYVDIEDATIFTNVNTPADYAALHGMLT
jgi:molybdenum cofactor guanylyltransferase